MSFDIFWDKLAAGNPVLVREGAEISGQMKSFKAMMKLAYLAGRMDEIEKQLARETDAKKRRDEILTVRTEEEPTFNAGNPWPKTTEGGNS